MKEKFLIAHQEWGVFLGTAMGMAFWSNMDPVGQDCAILFESAEHAAEYVKTWESVPPGITTSPVLVTEGQTHATMDQCVEAGFRRWDPGHSHIQISVKGEMASIIEKSERLIVDAASKKDENWLKRIATMLYSLSLAANRRAGAVEHGKKDELEKERLFVMASRDGMERAAKTLDDDAWAEWDKTGRPPTSQIVTVKPEGAAANDSIQRPPDDDLIH